MNTLTDLRRTLDEHADDVADPAAVARTTAIRHRVTVVRRRRVAGAALAAALALVAGSAVILLPKSEGGALPAAPMVLGVKAPTTQQSLGYTYRTDGRSSAFGGSGTIDVRTSDEPQLFSWTMSPNARVTLTLPNDDVWHSDVSHFGDFVVIQPGVSGPMKISVSSGSVGVASYALTDAVPERAFSSDGITFRGEVAGDRLLRGILTSPGETDWRSTIAPARRVTMRLVCAGLPAGYEVHVRVGRHGGGPLADSSDCGDPTSFDPASGTSYTSRVRDGRTRVPVRIWVTTKSAPSEAAAQARPADVPGLRIGLGVYATGPTVKVDGSRVPRTLERDGHTWSFSSGSAGTVGQPLAPGTALVDRLAWVALRTHAQTMVRFRAGSYHGGVQTSGGGQVGVFFAPAGTAVDVDVTGGPGTFGVAFYERTD